MKKCRIKDEKKNYRMSNLGIWSINGLNSKENCWNKKKDKHKKYVEYKTNKKTQT